MLSTLQTIGSFVGLATGVFVVIDRFARFRPIAYLRPTDDPEYLDLVVRNTAKTGIVITAITCNLPTARVSFRDDWRDVLDPDYVDALAFIAPETEKRFTWMMLPGWEKQKPEDRIRITIRWSVTSSFWHRQVPVWHRNTVGRLDSLRSAIRPVAE